MKHGAKQYIQFNSRARMVLHEPSIGKQTKLRNKRKPGQRNEQKIFVADTDDVVMFRGHTVQRTKTAAHRQRCAYVLSRLCSMSRKRKRHATRQHRHVAMVVVWVLWRTLNADAAQHTNKTGAVTSECARRRKRGLINHLSGPKDHLG
jgi:hypothetical protein